MTDSTMNADVIIVGGGPAGYAAAVYAARASLQVLVVEQGMPGGQIATTDEVENYPAIQGISGAELGQRFQEHAEALGAKTVYAMVTAVRHEEDQTFTVVTDQDELRAPSLIMATGATPRTVGFEGEDTYRGRGISYCATCDGMFYRGKKVFVIGGGNAACEEAMFLTNFASEVVVVVRRDQFRAPRGVVDRMLANPKISVKYSTSVTKVEGGTFLHSIAFKNNESGETYTEEYPEGSFGVFVFAGTLPQTELFSELVELGGDGGVIADENMATKTPGLFCAGDVRSKQLRQVITAAADGAIAGTAAYQYVSEFRK